MAFPALTRSALGLMLLAALAGCSKKADMGETPAAVMEASQAPAPAVAAGAAAPPAQAANAVDEAVTSATPAQQMGSSAATYSDGERKFIRTASARFAVKDVYVAALGIEDIVASHGGFVVDNAIVAETVSSSAHPAGNGKLLELKEYVVKGTLTVRVPSSKTQEFLRAITGHMTFLDARQFAARDAQFDLLRQQLDALRNNETQRALTDAASEGGKLAPRVEALHLSNDSKAARDAAILARKEFEDQVAFSTIELTMYQPARVLKSESVDVDAVTRDHQPGFATRLGENLLAGWHGVLEAVLLLIYVWPVTLALLGVGVMVWRSRRRVKPAAPAA